MSDCLGAVAITAPPRYRCPKGHETGSAGGVFLFGVTTFCLNGEQLRSSEICAACLFEWLRATFPTTEVR